MSVVLLPGDVLYDGFLSAVTLVVEIIFSSSELNALLTNVPFNHVRNEQVPQVTSVYVLLYGLQSSAKRLITRSSFPSLARISHNTF